MKRLSLFQRFSIIGFAIMILGTLGVGWWLGNQIKAGVIRETASTSALYMNSFIAPYLQELNNSETLTKDHIYVLNQVLTQANLGRQIVTFKVWDRTGRILFSSTPELIGKSFPIDEDLASAWQGNIAANISDLKSSENVIERQSYSQLLQIYSPIRKNGTDQIIAVAELYQKVDALQADINSAQRKTWLAVGLTMLLIYLALVGFVRRTSDTIEKQRSQLTRQVERLIELLSQNGDLQERLRRALANTTKVNERFLRRISAELHDGPVQELGAALLRMDSLTGRNQVDPSIRPDGINRGQIPEIQSSMQRAIQEVRAIASGLGLPQLDGLTLDEVLKNVVEAHEHRTGTQVKLNTENLPEMLDLSIKIVVYRIVQEALNNAFRHAGGMEQRVQAERINNKIQVIISDQGAGFDVNQSVNWEEHLGLAGMRQRVESLGGKFTVESGIDQGTRVSVSLDMEPIKDEPNGKN